MDEIGLVERWLLKKDIRLNAKGKRWADNIEGTLFMLTIIASILFVGFIEGIGNH